MSTKDFEKCAVAIRIILNNLDDDGLEYLVRNAVVYAESNNACKTNYIASILFKDAIPDELIKRIFDEE